MRATQIIHTLPRAMGSANWGDYTDTWDLVGEVSNQDRQQGPPADTR